MLPAWRYFLVLLALGPGLHVGGAGPVRLDRNIIAKTLVLKRAGQLEALAQIEDEPPLLDAGVPAVELKPPLACQGSRIGGGGSSG